MICFIFGLFATVVPTIFEPIYGVILNPVGIIVCRWFGATLIGLGLITWFAREAESSPLKESMILAIFFVDVIGFGVSLMGQLSEVVTELGWSIVVIWFILAAGFGYFKFGNYEI